VDLYEQQIEVALIGALRAHLETGSFVDVGAERGAFTHALLAQGLGPADLIEASPTNVAELTRVFAGRDDVTIHGLAAIAGDGEVVLNLAGDGSGTPSPAHNSLRALPADGGRTWTDSVAVPGRSLGSLVDEGVLPARVGFVKIDVEGGDRDVIEGMGSLECEALMLEHWLDVPGVEGPCPWTTDEIRALLEPRGLSELLYVQHRPGHVTRIVSGAADPQTGDWGNLILLTPELRERAHDAIGLVAELAGRIADARLAAVEKEEQIQLLARAAEERLAAIEELDAYRQEADRRIASLRAELGREG
jgi:FkbM family methyltransferase